MPNTDTETTKAARIISNDVAETSRGARVSMSSGPLTDERGVRQQTPQPNALVAVTLWELRRLTANRSTWLSVALAFLLFALITLLLKDSQSLAYGQAQYSNGVMARPDMIRVAGTSAWGMTITVPKYLLLVFGMFLPFMAAEGVAWDFRRRTHEVLMATQVPTWAFVIGRYVAVLLTTLGLATVMLVAVLITGTVLSLWLSYPAPNTQVIVALWLVAVVPASILLSGLSFALGTLLPRRSNGVKAVLLVVWVLSQFAGALWESEQSPYAVVDAAGVVMSQVIQSPYAQDFFTSVTAQSKPEKPVSRDQAVAIIREVEQTMPDLWPWVLPRAVYAGVGLTAVVLAAVRFRRFRNV